MNKEKIYINTNWKRFFITFILASFGELIFSLIHLPIPWLLGPMTALLIGSRIKGLSFYWPVYIRDIGLIIVGYALGLSFTKDALNEIIHQLPSMFLMTLLLITFCALIAFMISKLSGIEFPTIMTGSIPGGLSQIITLAEEMKDINLTIVTFMQVSRLIMIIFFVPLLIYSPFFGVEKSKVIIHSFSAKSDFTLFNLVIFAILSVICALLGKKIKMPTPFLLGPLLATAALNMSGFHGPNLPSAIINISQFMIGGYVGLLLKPENLPNKVKITILSLFSGCVLMIGSLGLSLLLEKLHNSSPATSFLSVAPGGMDQMGIIAHSIHADLSMVTGYQLFRILFIYFVIPPLLKWAFIYLRRNKAKSL